MGKTSVYLTSDLDARWRKCGVPLAEVFRRGLEAIEGTPDLEATLTRGLDGIREEVAALRSAVASGSQRGYDEYEPA